jgi:hypothetical protein
LRNAIIWNRSSSVWARNVVSSKMVGSGQKRTVVPLWPAGRLADGCSASLRSPPSMKSIAWRVPSRSISTSSLVDSAFTTDTPTPWSPPETL